MYSGKQFKGKAKRTRVSLHLNQKGRDTERTPDSDLSVMKIIQSMKARTEKHIPAFDTLEGGHTISTHFQGILLYTQKQTEATK